MAQIIKGDEIAADLLNNLKLEINNFERAPKLAVILVGDDFASKTYVRAKSKAANKVGIEVDVLRFDIFVSEEEIIKQIKLLNEDKLVDGILIQLPLPKHLNTKEVLNKVRVSKDVDGFTYYNAGRLFRGDPLLEPCTPKGVMKMLEAKNIDVSNKNAVVVGRSNLVGLPLARMLTAANATVTICHSQTNNLREFTKKADLLFVAIGKSKFIKADDIKEGAIIIDIGISRDDNNKLSGDVDFDNVKDKASMISPVPKGVGPLTIAMLLSNTVSAYKGGLCE